MNGLEFGFGICYGDAKAAEGNIWGSRWGSYPRGVNKIKKEEKKRMKKFLSLCMAFMLVLCGIPAMNASASVVSTINPTDGYTQTVKTVTTTPFTICETQVAETATVSGSAISGTAILSDTANVVIETSNDNVKVDKVTSPIIDASGNTTGKYVGWANSWEIGTF